MAVANYERQENSEINLKAGETVDVIEKSESGESICVFFKSECYNHQNSAHQLFSWLGNCFKDERCLRFNVSSC